MATETKSRDMDDGEGWVPASSADERAMASLLTVARSFQSEIGVAEVRALNEGQIPRVATLLSLLGNARKIGFAPLPLEGEYDALDEVPLPAIVQIRRGDEDLFLVLQQFTHDRVVVLDPLTGTGPRELARAEFEAEWTGDVVVVRADPEGSARVQAQLREARRLAPKLGFASALVGLLLVLVLLVATRTPSSWSIAAALSALYGSFVAALWLLYFGEGCKVCSRGKIITGGLPLELAGSLAYAGLALALACSGPQPWIVMLIAAAAGGHLTLMNELRRHRIACTACLAAGSLVLLASALLLSSPSAWSLLATVPVGAAGMWLLVRASARRVTTRSLRLAWSVADALPNPPERSARAVVYKRHGCSACVLFETALQPALELELGDAIEFESRYEDGALLHTPVLSAVGHDGTRVVALGLGAQGRELERLRAIFMALLEPRSRSSLALLEDVYLREPAPPAPSERAAGWAS